MLLDRCGSGGDMDGKGGRRNGGRVKEWTVDRFVCFFYAFSMLSGTPPRSSSLFPSGGVSRFGNPRYSFGRK